MIIKSDSNNQGMILVNVLVFGVIAIIVTTSLVNWAATMLKNTRQLTAREQAFQIAEAGIDYYRWHLAHATSDFKDGTGTTTSNGPFIHTFEDKDGVIIGSFELTITPPITGSTLTKVVSKGTVLSDANVSRSIQVTFAIPSFARFAMVANAPSRFGVGTEVFGPIHSNSGIRFDGLAHNTVTSAVEKYIDTDVGVNRQKWGVYTNVGTDDPNPPTPVPSRPDVFMAGRQFPVAQVDFAGITASLSAMKTIAVDAGSAGRYYTSSGLQGYHIVLKENDTYDIYMVNTLVSASKTCTYDGQTTWGTWSISTETLFKSGVTFPENGIIFFEDNVWVDGKINGARLSIVAATFPEDLNTWKNIIVNKDLLYTNYDGTDSISLIAQGNITTGLNSNNILRIDAALVAQKGRIGRYAYFSQCGTNYKRSTITLYGMIASSERYGFSYVDGNDVYSNGYLLRNIIYDGNLLYAPPPSFPLTSNQYSTLSWEELK